MRNSHPLQRFSLLNWKGLRALLEERFLHSYSVINRWGRRSNRCAPSGYVLDYTHGDNNNNDAALGCRSGSCSHPLTTALEVIRLVVSRQRNSVYCQRISCYVRRSPHVLCWVNTELCGKQAAKTSRSCSISSPSI